MNNKEKPSVFKRSVAYLIDMLVVSLLASIIVTVFIGNNMRKSNYTEELLTLRELLNSKEITQEEYNIMSNDLVYMNAKDSVGLTITMSGVALVYYVVLCYIAKGITLGKYLMKLQIVSNNGKKLNLFNYLVRGLLVNLILIYILNATLVLTLDKDGFLSVYQISSNVLVIFLFISFVFAMYRNDGRALHDIICNTKIISTKVVNENVEVKEEVVDAKVIEEKKTTNKKKKAVKKTGGKK